MDIIQYLLSVIQYLYQQNCWLIHFICKYIPLRQWAFDDSHSPKYQKFKTDELPRIGYRRDDWDWQLLIPYFEFKYHKKIKPVSRRKECDIPQDCKCPACNAPQPYLYRNNGRKGQIKCKVCDTNFSLDDSRFSRRFTLRCPHCGNALAHKKDRKHFILHKCVNPKCPYYLHNLKFFHEFGEAFQFHITQVIGLTNGDAVSKEFRPFKQMLERLNRTYKTSYRKTNGFDNIDGANYDLALWVAYYNFLRPHKYNNYRVLNEVDLLKGADNMPGKWQLLIFLGQQTILNLQKSATA